MKKFFPVLLLLFLISCTDKKKGKLDKLFAEKTKLQGTIDTLKMVIADEEKKVAEEPRSIIKFALAGNKAQLDTLGMKMDKIDYSIDSLSKY